MSMRKCCGLPRQRRGFTLVELLVVLAVVATLLTLIAPRYWGTETAARETVLKENLRALRVALDQYYADRGAYPDALSDLVDARYLRTIPIDPVTGSAETWRTVAPKPSEVSSGGIADVRSGASGADRQGTPFVSF